jgi:hypothetical protein
MTHAYYVEEHGTRDYREGIPLSGNPYNPAIAVDAHEAWRTGWLEASRARGRYLLYPESPGVAPHDIL